MVAPRGTCFSMALPTCVTGERDLMSRQARKARSRTQGRVSGRARGACWLAPTSRAVLPPTSLSRRRHAKRLRPSIRRRRCPSPPPPRRGWRGAWRAARAHLQLCSFVFVLQTCVDEHLVCCGQLQRASEGLDRRVLRPDAHQREALPTEVVRGAPRHKPSLVEAANA